MPADMDVASLPDDPQALRLIVLQQQRTLHERDELLALRERRIAQTEREREERDAKIAELERKQQQLELEKLLLQHRLDLLLKRYYGPRADKVEVNQLLLEFAVALEERPVDPADLPSDATAEQADPQQGRRVRRGRGRRRIAAFEKLPVRQEVHDLPEEQKCCPGCGGQRQEIGRESSWQIEHIPAEFLRIEHIQIKYGCGQCERNGHNPRIELAAKPHQPIEKGMAGPGLLAYVAVSKYADSLPLYRLEDIFERHGFEIDRSTLCLWMRDVAEIVRPIYKRMIARVLCSHVIHTDDTVLPMLAPEKAKKARIWTYVGDREHPYNIYDFTTNRGRDGPARFLGDYDQVLQADAYGGYDGISIEKKITLAGCWAHARRKFTDTQKLHPQIATEALELIGMLFRIERRAKQLSHDDRLAMRTEKSGPVTSELHEKLLMWRQQLLPKDPVAQAVGYVLNQWKPLTAFLADGAIALDNNIAEREMKRIAVGRKNYLFVGSPRGGETAAILCSITSTCRRHDINPQLYLTQLLSNLPATPMSQLDQWLPDQWHPLHLATAPTA
jgi:transposase